MRTRSGERGPITKDEATAATREFLTVSQLAELLQLTEMTIYRMVNRGDLPCYAIGRIKRFRHRDVEEFLESHRLPAGESSHSRSPRRTARRKQG